MSERIYDALASSVSTGEQECAVAGHRVGNRIDAGWKPPRLQLFCKRVFDIAISGTLLICIGPFLLLLALAIRLESPGSPLFVQKRWGKDQKEVSIYKFRSMWADKGDHSGVQQTVAGDSRITKIGAFIRKTNIDELPQLLNVLLGDMSLIGPRCHPIGMKSAGMLYEDLCPDYHERHQMRPGITGLAQVRGLRGPTVRSRDGRARLASDLYYVRHYSFMLDLKIFFGTFYREIMRGGRGF